MSAQGKSIKLGETFSGDATAKPLETITSTELVEFECLGVGGVPLESFCETLDLLLHHNIHLSDWIIQEGMKRGTLSGPRLKTRTVIVGTPGRSIRMDSDTISKMSATQQQQLLTKSFEEDWIEDGTWNVR